MSHSALRVVDYLEHIVQAVERIRKYTDNLDEAASPMTCATSCPTGISRSILA